MGTGKRRSQGHATDRQNELYVGRRINSGLATDRRNRLYVGNMKDAYPTRTLAALRRSRPCRVCGTVFRPERWDALTCSDTCRSRRGRGQGLAYVADLPQAQQAANPELHPNAALAIQGLKSYRPA